MKKRKNILIVVHHLGIGGGAERIAGAVSSGLAEKGHNVFVLIFYKREKTYAHDGKVICLNEKLTSDLFTMFYKMISRAKKIKNICKENKIDTVISFMNDGNVSAVLSKTIFRNKSKIIISQRINPMIQTKTFKFLTKQLYPKADLVVSVSKKVESILRESFNVKKATTIYNFKNIKEITKQSNEKIPKKHEKLFDSSNVFINIGRLGKQKNHSGLIRAFKKITENKKDAKLLIIGSGNYEKKLKTLINSLNLQNNVFLLGQIENVYPYIKKSDAFIFAPNWEGMPNVLLEALVLKKPIISTDCISGPREILCPELKIDEKINYPYYGKYGILLETFQDPVNFNTLKEKPLSKQEKSLAETMEKLIKDKKLQKKYSIGLERAKYFDKEKIISEWEEVV